MNRGKIIEKYFEFWRKVWNFKGNIKIHKVDFDKSWWGLFFKQKVIFAIVFITQVIDNIFWVFLPFLISFAFVESDLNFFVWVVGLRFLMNVVIFLVTYLQVILETSLIYSIYYRSIEKVLIVDPIYQTQKSTGEVVAKIDRGSDAIEGVLDILLYRITPVTIGILTASITFFQYDFILGMIAILMMILIIASSVIVNFIDAKVFNQMQIDFEDAQKQTGTESIYQAHYIRSVFAVKEQLGSLLQKTNNLMERNAVAWQTSEFNFLIPLFLYNLSILILGIQIFSLIESDGVDPIIGLGLISTYFAGTTSILNVGNTLRNFLKRNNELKDLFKFMREYGHQTYPVLEK